MTDLTREMPKIGQSVDFKGLTITITDVSQRRVKTIRVTKNQPSEKDVPETVAEKSDLEASSV